jgi:outer membrane immunogenic protein
MKNSLLAAIALTMPLCSAAIAADLPLKSPPVYVPSVPTWSWSGFYLGINGGYGVGSDNFTQTEVRSPAVVTEGSFASNTIAPKGGLFGGQLGINWQTGPVVLGVEGDLQWANQSSTVCGSACTNTVSNGTTFVGVARTVDQKINWFGTARGRVGWANDGAMIYASAGGAWMGVDETDSTTVGIVPGAPVVTNAASFSNTRKGYAVGAGMEMRVWANMVAKIEYLHIDVAGTGNSFVPPFFVGPGGSLTTTSSRIHDDLVRVGLNWKFSGAPFGF